MNWDVVWLDQANFNQGKKYTGTYFWGRSFFHLNATYKQLFMQKLKEMDTF